MKCGKDAGVTGVTSSMMKVLPYEAVIYMMNTTATNGTQ
jgi:hypothetical protein